VIICFPNQKQKVFEKFDRILLVGGSTRMPQVKEILETKYTGIPIEFNEPDEAVAKGAALFAQKLIIEKKIDDELFKIYGDKKDEIKKIILKDSRMFMKIFHLNLESLRTQLKIG